MIIEGDNNPLGNGAGIANDLDQLFRSGNFGEAMNSFPQESDPPTQDELLKQKIEGHIEAFCRDISPSAARILDRRQAANEVRVYFDSWKDLKKKELRRKSAPESEIMAMDELTLKDVAKYTSEQFRAASKDAAILEFGSSEQLQARKNSERWSILEEVISPAADPD